MMKSNAAAVVAIDVGGTRTKLGIVDPAHGHIRCKRVWPTELTGFTPFIERVAHEIQHAADTAGIRTGELGGIGMGLPGFVAHKQVSAMWPPLAFLEGSTFCAQLEAATHLSVRLDNDARVVALGEAHFGQYRDARRLLSLTLGSGLGVSLVVYGQLQETTSATHLAGHIPIRPGARQCYCGFSGCLESLVSASALIDLHAQRTQAPAMTRAEDVFAAAEIGDPESRQTIAQFLGDLIAGLNAYIYVFAPDAIVIGGGVAARLKPYLPQIRAELFAKPFDRYRVRLGLTRLKERAGILGGAALWSGSPA